MLRDVMKIYHIKNSLSKKGLYIFDKLLNLILIASGLGFLWIIWQVFFWSSFVVPTPSMEPEIIPGDRVAVWKPWMGARLFNFFAALGNEQPPIYRLPGLRMPERGDILVFNYPYSDGWDKLTLSIKEYYVKRCIALPGDTLRIRQGVYQVAHFTGALGNIESQCALGHQSEALLKERHLWSAYPHDSLLNWNVKDFGPLKIPAQGDKITLNPTNYCLYRPLIEWETKNTLRFVADENKYYLGKHPLTIYCFRQNYYFMGGDQAENSIDSRYWGLVPESFIVGRVGWISESRDPTNGRPRWKRWIKRVK